VNPPSPIDARSDLQILERLHKRDETALEELLRTHIEPLRRHAISLLGDESEAMDVIMDAFIRLWERPPAPAPGTNLGGYLATAVRNSCLNVLRARAVRDRVHDVFAAAEESPAMSTLPLLADEEMERIEAIQAVQKALAELPVGVRRVALLRWGTGSTLTPEDIAARLGISVRTVQNYLSLAIRALKERFSGRAEY
jgi:RNA polymerase sigma factor (sigma-70 family)